MLSSKVGRLLVPNPAAAPNQHGYADILPFDQRWDFSADGTLRSIEASLQRLGLARLLVSQRPLWLLDEPFAALDTSGQQLVGQLMARHCGAGGIIIAATHEPLGLGNESLKL